MKAFPALKFSREEVEVRRRTWWTIYIIDKYIRSPSPANLIRYICAWQGRPTTIVHQEFDTQFPEDAVVPSPSKVSNISESRRFLSINTSCFICRY